MIGAVASSLLPRHASPLGRWDRPVLRRFLAGLVFFFLGSPGFIAGQTLLIQADEVLTSTPDGLVGPRFVLVQDGKIASITLEPPGVFAADLPSLHTSFLTPGLIDARTTLGLSGLHPDDDDQDETSGPNQAHLRALDAFDLDDPMVRSALEGGVTTVHTGPGDANSVGGQAGIFKLWAETVEQALVRFPSALVLSLDETAKLTYGKTNRFPSTRMANVGLIRQALVDADRYRAEASGEDPPARDLKKEALALALDRKIPAVVSAERADEVVTALRLGEEFGLDLWIVGAAEVTVVMDRLADSGSPVLLGPVGDVSLREEHGRRYSGAAPALQTRSIPFALVTGDDRNAPRTSLLDLARGAMRDGLTLRQAVEAITIGPARILGLDGSLGSIEVGKDADLVLFDGDPSEASTRVSRVLVKGAVAYQRRN